MKILPLALLVVALSSSYAQTRWTWAKSFGSPTDTTNYTGGNDIAVDQYGFSYVAGEFNGSTIFGSTTFNSGSTSSFVPDGYISKLDLNGNVIWTKRISGIVFLTGIALDNIGNIYVTGHFYGEANFIPGSTSPRAKLISSGGENGFVAKYNTEGVALWATKISGSGIYCNDITIDATGNAYVVGDFFGNILNETASITSLGDLDIFVAKLTSSGSLVWIKAAGGVNTDNGVSIKSDKSDKIYITGKCRANANFDGLSVTVAPPPPPYTYASEFFFASYQTDGSINFVRQSISESLSTATGHAVAVDPDATGYIYVAGNAFGNTQLEGSSLHYGYFIAKYDRYGTLIWVRNQGNSYIIARSIDVSTLGVFVAGYYTGTMEFGLGSPTVSGTTTLTCASGFGVFVSAYTKNGAFHFVTEAPADGYETINSIAVSTKNFHVTGNFPISSIPDYMGGTGPMMFGSIALPRLKGVSTFVAKYDHIRRPPVTSLVSDSESIDLFYPNPVNRYLIVTTESPAEIIIRDMTGNLVQINQKKTSEPETIDLINLKSGWYIVEIKTEAGTKKSKLLKE